MATHGTVFLQLTANFPSEHLTDVEVTWFPITVISTYSCTWRVFFEIRWTSAPGGQGVPSVWMNTSRTLGILGTRTLSALAHALFIFRRFLGSSVVKNPPANAGDPGDTGSIPRSGRSPGGEGVASFSSILAWRTLMERGAWRATVHGVTEPDMT